MKYKLEKYQTNNIVEQICLNRGINYNDIEFFLNPNVWSITNPFIYKNMKEVATKIIDNIEQNKKIGILIDSDVDGYCSSSALINYIKDTFNYNNIKMFIHDEKQHGLTPYIMNCIKSDIPDLLIIPDASSSDFEQHKELCELGIDIVIIDHHETEKYSKYAIVVNNQLNVEGNKTLSAGGMVMKLLEAIDILTSNSNAENYLDLIAVSLVGDSMLMNNTETRYYVQKGINNINNKLLKEMININKENGYDTISFDIAPIINAFIRVAEKEDKQLLYMGLLNHEQNIEFETRGKKINLSLQEYIIRVSNRIKSKQSNEIKEALENVSFLDYENYPFVICILPDNARKSLTGLIGNRLVDKYKKPAIVLKDLGKSYSGSGRTTEMFEDFKGYCNSTGFFDLAQGHKGAFGVVISKVKYSKMMIDLKGKVLDDNLECYIVEKEYINKVSAFDIMAVSELNKFWSKGFNKPLFYIKLELEGNELDIIGTKKNTIRIKKDNITYIKFSCSEEEIDNIKNKKIKEIEIIGTFDVNEYYDRLYPQVHILDYEFKIKEKPNKNIFGFEFNDLTKNKW